MSEPQEVEAGPQEEEEEGEEEEEEEHGEGEEDESLEPPPDAPPAWTSGWDDDSNDVDPDPDPHATPEREILWACEHGHQSVVERILEQHPEAVGAQDSDGYTPLHRAAYSDFPEIVKLLLGAGASVSARTADGWLPLHSACRWNHHTCALILLDAGSDINAATNSGQTPLHLAAVNPQAKETLQLLLKSRDIKPTLTNSNGETAKDISVRSGPFAYLFEVTDPVLNVLEDPE
ncbi:ankyrin repeat domain-containing protein 49-like [Eriocheir sinensis]|uniref:ankyrin repeat domain-containing protein 49-like n=1 Tax=Eriocheir sinensis TaxID=95602 RepID=UPI0021CAB732|nr:ankyrin repeat domain-containing protein 49-like [Eriocheir sinensis]